MAVLDLSGFEDYRPVLQDKTQRDNLLRFACNQRSPEAILSLICAVEFRRNPTRNKLCAYYDVFLDINSSPLMINEGESSDKGLNKILPATAAIQSIAEFVKVLGRSTQHISVPNTSLNQLFPILKKNASLVFGDYRTESRRTSKIGIGQFSKTFVSYVSIPLTYPLRESSADGVLALKGGGFDTRDLGFDALCKF